MSIELNAQNYKSVAKGVMEAKDLHMRNKFSSVNSAYTVTGKNVRYSLDFTEEQLKVAKEIKKSDKWKLVSIDVFKGKLKDLEKHFIKSVKEISKNIK